MMCLFGGLSSLLAQETVAYIALGTAGKQANKIPFSTQVTYTHSQQLLTPDVIKAGNNGKMPEGKITKIAFEHYTAGTEMYCDKLSVYMIHTDLKELTTTMTQEIGSALYTGSAQTNTKTNCFEITLTTPFEYDGKSNILLCLDVNSKPSVYSGDANFVTTSTSTGFGNYYSCVYKSSNTTNYGPDANSWATGTRARYTNAMYLTFVGDEEVVIPDPNAPTLSLPSNKAENQIKPLIRFTIGENTTHYQIWMGTTDSTMTAKTEWIETEKDDEVDYQTSNLTYNPATTYYWKVIARNGDTEDAPTKESSVYSFTTRAITAEPEAAKYINPENSITCTTSYPNLKWEYDETTFEYKVLVGFNYELKDDKDAEGDYVQNNDIKQNWTAANLASGNSYQTSGLTADTTYYWRVDVKNDEGTTKGDVYSFTIPGVKNISNAEASDGKLTWTFDEYATQYRVLLGTPRTDNDAAKKPLETYCTYLEQFQTAWMNVPADKQGSFTLPTNDIIAGKTYYWTVDVKNFADDKIYSNYVWEYSEEEGKNVQVFTPEVKIYSFVTSSMTPVDNTSPKNEEKDLNNPMLKWSFNGSSATYYQVYLGTDKDNLTGQGWTARTKDNLDGSEEYNPNGSFQTSNLTANTTYYWRVDVTDAEDPTAEGISVYEGATWSFLSHLPAPEPSANPTQIKPEYAIVYGGTTISWDILNGVTGYNVYLDGTKDENKLNSKLLGANHNYYTIAPEDRKLQYNMKDEEGNGGYDIYVEAVYETTTKKSEAVNVTVTGVGFLSVDVVDETTTTKKYVAGATIKLTQIKDEWGNTEDLKVYEFTTDENGQYLSSKEGNERPLIGTYKISVEKENYTQKLAEDESDEIVITYNETTTKKLTLVLNIPDNVTPVTPINEAEGVTDQTIVWDFAEGTDEYRFYFGKSQIGLEKLCDWTAVGENNRMEFKLSGLEAETTYYWAVDVRNELGARQAFGDNAAEVEVYSFTTGETLPVVNTAPANGATNLTNPTLKWKYNGNATRYMVRLGESEDALYPYPDGNWKTRGEEETGSLTTASLKERTKYYWRVDVLDANDNAYIGDVWSFVSTLPAPVATASPTQIVPTLSGTYGETTISWKALEGATGYNVYIGTEKLNAEILSAETKEYTIAANTLKLTHNMENGYDIYVEAVYELGNSMSKAVNVKVTGSGFLNAEIVKSFNTNLGVDGATITLTQLEDEFGNVYENGAVTTFITDENGNLNNERERVFNGKYAVEVSRKYYETYKGTIEFKQGQETELEVTLKAESEYVFEVSTSKNTFNSIHIYLENTEWGTAQSGNYNVYLKNGEEVTMLGNYYFAPTAAGNDGVISVYFIYEGWANLSKGSYQFGVAKTEDQINWSATVTRNYDIFDGEDSDWNNPESWKDGVVPGEGANAHIFKPVTINGDVTVATVTIENGGKLTINGSLTANEVVNNGGAANALCLNDGGQLRQTVNAKLNGVFNMKVTAPTAWDNTTNKDGWQFIASPFTNAEVEAWTTGSYDFYKYDGKQQLEWINEKDNTNENFETEFVQGRGYLASHENENITLSGTFNNATTYTWEGLTYNEANDPSDPESKDLANFYLLGNPFTFNMDMSAVKYNSLVEGFAIVNAEGGYTYVGADQETTTIPVGDGFFVKVKEPNATDVISLSYGTNETRSSREKSANINLVATSKAGKDNVVINFAGQSEGFNKLQNFNDEIATVCVVENGKAYGIYNCESDVNEIEVMFSAKQMGSYSLSFDINGEFETVTLVDRMTGVETDMIEEGEYNFIATSNDMKNRFVVRLSNSMTATEEFLANFVYQSGEELIVNAEGTIQIIDMMGRVVYSAEHSNGSNRINVSEFNNAAYVVRVVNGNGVKSQKVVIY